VAGSRLVIQARIVRDHQSFALMPLTSRSLFPGSSNTGWYMSYVYGPVRDDSDPVIVDAIC
jgi:hypothetical protein